jgi:hypothetical protein
MDLSSITSEEVAQALFPEPIYAAETLGKQRQPDLLKLAALIIQDRFKKYYQDVSATTIAWSASMFGPEDISCQFPISQQRWIGNRSVKFYCQRCKEREHRRCSLIGLAQILDSDGKFGLKMTHIYFHNHDCCNAEPTKGLQAESSRLELVPFDFETIIGDIYSNTIRKLDSITPKTPFEADDLPGNHINFEFDGYEEIDDRHYADFSAENVPVEVSQHRKVLVRIMYHLAAHFNIAKEVCPYQVDYLATVLNAESNKAAGLIWDTTHTASADSHLFLTESSLLYGGHDMRTQEEKDNSEEPIHQMTHQDGQYAKHPFSDNYKLNGKFTPGTVLIPLKDSRTIYVLQPSNKVMCKKGCYLYFQGDLDHGGMTYAVEDKEWYPAIHVHLDSKHHQRPQGDVLLCPQPVPCYLPMVHAKHLSDEQLEAHRKATNHQLELLSQVQAERLLSQVQAQRTAAEEHPATRRSSKRNKTKKT